MKQYARNGVPTESQEQQALFRWAAYARGVYPELNLLYHIPNEGLRSVQTGARLKSEGMKPGVPDICLPIARGPYHALYIEMKRTKRGRVTDTQQGWISALNRVGNKAVVCKGWQEAVQVLKAYLDLNP